MNKPLIVITGASSGIGAAIAKVFSREGFSLALLARNKAAMLDLNLPQTLCLQVDVTDASALKQAIAQAESVLGSVDCLINNAGFAKDGDFTEMAHNAHDSMVQINLMGVINGIEAVLPGMQQRKSGTIINMSSLADRKSRPQLATYAATKAAVKSLTESLRMANAQYGVRVCNVAPAKIKTPLLMQSALSLDHCIDSEDMAKAILWIYQQPKTICIRDMVIAPTYYEA